MPSSHQIIRTPLADLAPLSTPALRADVDSSKTLRHNPHVSRSAGHQTPCRFFIWSAL
ncbi:hypothetical protein PAMC26510_33055 [Caballeronia sordidicola]|uniref:Uncharacterized protein n=1 Tax=Caballeronia sordidicola TaxID=196367 RepID=A0A242M7R4_CABSO|nr:hypothetical protein PAMC26510_33055 [Caballeronia sordidicola]